jgi:putative ABC transport system permease protein
MKSSRLIAAHDTVAMALGTLRTNPLRSLLTLLGIVIGASTVVAMMSLTEGLRLKVTRDLAVLGAGSFQVQKWPAINVGGRHWMKYAKRKNLTREQGQALQDLPHVAHVSVQMYHHDSERLRTRERSTDPNIYIIGATPEYEYANAVNIASGRFISDVDVALGRAVIVIGADVADALFPNESPLGQEIRVYSTPVTVIGVLERMGSILGLESKDAIALLPLDTYLRVMGSRPAVDIAVQATSPEDVPKAIDEVTLRLRRLRGVPEGEENDFEIFTNDSLAETFNNLAALVGTATFGLCALALLVGGIGIMNIMLVSVTERTAEIGLRKALGARRQRILVQFVVEAVVLSFLGGVLGVALGASVAVLARELYSVPSSVPSWAVALALAAASGTGLIFGIYPAARASRLDPVEAMRVE